jgi:hypothetical protein
MITALLILFGFVVSVLLGFAMYIAYLIIKAMAAQNRAWKRSVSRDEEL